MAIYQSIKDIRANIEHVDICKETVMNWIMDDITNFKDWRIIWLFGKIKKTKRLMDLTRTYSKRT